MKWRPNFNYFWAFLFFLLIEILIAVFVHDRFIRPYVGDMLVVVVLYCLLRVFIKPYTLLPVWLFLFATAIEIAQYFDLVSIFNLYDYPILAIALGSTFDFLDILCYLIGCLWIFLWQKYLFSRN